MKKSFLLNSLINILIFLYIIGLIGLIILIPLKKCIISPIKICIVDWNIFYWFIAVISVFALLSFLKSLFHLRKIVKLQAKESSSNVIDKNLIKCGTGFITSGIIYFSIVILLWIYNAIETEAFEIGFEMDLVPPLFIIVIGMFFKMQSKPTLN